MPKTLPQPIRSLAGHLEKTRRTLATLFNVALRFSSSHLFHHCCIRRDCLSSHFLLSHSIRPFAVIPLSSSSSFTPFPSTTAAGAAASVAFLSCSLLSLTFYFPIFSPPQLVISPSQVFPDPKGGLYYNRDGMRLIDQPTASKIPGLERPGYKVMHVQDVDYRATCLTFVECLKQLNSWSVKNPGHLPITVKVEVKYSSLVNEIGSIASMILPNAAIPPEITPALLTDLEKEVLSVIPRWKVLKPDNVRGNYPTLAGAVKTKGWPSLAVASGKFMFVLVGNAIDTYKQKAPSLQGKLFFTGPTTGGTPDAAVVSMEVDYSSAKEDVQQLLKDNVIVWTRADADTVQARANDGTRRQVALTSGAQIVHTDYPAAERPNPFGTPYYVGLPMGRKAMCNPVTAPKWCRHYFLNEPIKA
ncbi:unnamed protein product [Closterium sp. NIES-53]